MGLEETREYDLQGRLVMQELQQPGQPGTSGTPVSLDQRLYSYDANGNLLDIDITPDPDLPKGANKIASSDPSWTYDVLFVEVVSVYQVSIRIIVVQV